MAHYQARGQLHFSDTREQALEGAVKQWAGLTERDGVRQVALMSDASTAEIDRMNARAQHLRAERGELGETEVELPDVAYGLRESDRVAFVAQHRPEGERRVENGTRGEILSVDPEQQRVKVLTDGAREVMVSGEDLVSLRLSYAQHLYRQQGATVERAVVVTGGWQTSQEGAYVQASRAREGTDWHIAREDLGHRGRGRRASRQARRADAGIARTVPLARVPRDHSSPDLGEELQRSTARQLAPDTSIHRTQGWRYEPRRDHAGRARSRGAGPPRAGRQRARRQDGSAVRPRRAAQQPGTAKAAGAAPRHRAPTSQGRVPGRRGGSSRPASASGGDANYGQPCPRSPSATPNVFSKLVADWYTDRALIEVLGALSAWRSQLDRARTPTRARSCCSTTAWSCSSASSHRPATRPPQGSRAARRRQSG